jgi:hypothetical protein
MNALQIVIVLFALLVSAIDVLAVIVIARSKVLKYKPVWIIFSLCGFVGLGINWSRPDDIFLQFGIQIPVIQVLYFIQARELAVKVMFPIVAIVALIREQTAAGQPLVAPPKLDGLD